MLNQLLQFDSDIQSGTHLCGHRRCGNVGEHLEEFAKEARRTVQARTNDHGVISFENIFCTSKCDNTVVARHC